MKFSELAKTYERVGGASGDPARVRLLAEMFRGADPRTLAAAAHFTLGEVVDTRLSERLGIGPATLRTVLARLYGLEAAAVDEEVRRTGDMSEVVAARVGGTDTLEVGKLWRRLNRGVERDESRESLVEHVFRNTTASGAKYFTRMVLNQMRIGAGLGTVARALASAFGVEPAAVEHLYAMTNDIGLVAAQARKGQRALARAGLTLFRPYQFMNAQKVDRPEEIFEKLKGRRIIFEVKYDGARLQIHLKKGRPPEIRAYSRRLNDDTAAMPDVAAALARAWKGGDAILEGEAVAYDPALRERRPFQAVLQRLGRVHGIEEKAREIPLVLHLFEMVYHDGEDLMNVPQGERRARLGKLFRPTERVKMTESVVTDSMEEQAAFFRRALEEGHEGLMAKDPDAAYVPGRRAEKWMKLKPAFETLDVVVTGGIWGSGRRKGLLSSLIVAVRDRQGFKTVGKVGTGFSEEALRELTARLEPRVISTRGRDVELEPEVVIEVDFQDIQKTARYRAGYALRIPRFKRVRTDKSTREADDLARLKRLYRQMHP
ncbi:MAG: ATP-dependent DNA ligase [Acidobacteria bacterium]|nr:ATP-dependent DNA ligase [Acidobacteriota bacterium]